MAKNKTIGTGYQGQRYEVWFKDESGEERRCGWTNSKKGKPLVSAIKKHPTWHSPRIVDLHKQEE